MAEFLKALKVAAAAAVLATGFATFAKADAPSPIVYFGVHGGKSIANTELSNDGLPIPMSLDGIGAHGFAGGVHAGVDLALGGGTGLNPFFGAFGGYTWQNVESKLTIGTNSATAGLGNSFYGGARVGLTSATGVKTYILGAYRQTDLEFSDANIGPSDLKGWDMGLGIEMPIARHVSLGLEGVWTKYESADVTYKGKDQGLNLDTDQLSVMARLNITLGGVQAIADDVTAPAPCDPKLAGCKKAKR